MTSPSEFQAVRAPPRHEGKSGSIDPGASTRGDGSPTSHPTGLTILHRAPRRVQNRTLARAQNTQMPNGLYFNL